MNLLWISRHPLFSFFTLTYAITYTIAFASSYWMSIPVFSFLWYTMIFSPTISAFIISRIVGGKDGIKILLVGFARWKVGFRWYVAAFSLTLIPLIVALCYIALGKPVNGISPGKSMPFLLFNLVQTLICGPISEETGWRGFALPRLQEKYSALYSSIILGFIWALWHLPFYFDSAGKVGIPFPIYIILIIVLTTFITWIYNNTNGSLGLCVLSHFCFNFNSAFLVGYLGLLPQMLLYIVCGAGLGLYVGIVIFAFGPKHLVKTETKSTEER